MAEQIVLGSLPLPVAPLNYFLRDDGTWAAAGGGMAIGNPVTGGGVNRILYEDGSSNLAASANLTWNGTQVDIKAPALSNNTFLKITGLAVNDHENRIDFAETTFGVIGARIAHYFTSGGGTNFGLRFYTGTGSLNTTPAMTLSGANRVTIPGVLDLTSGLQVTNSVEPVLSTMFTGAAGNVTALQLNWGAYPTGGVASLYDELRIDFRDNFTNRVGRIASSYDGGYGDGLKFYTAAVGGIPNSIPALWLRGVDNEAMFGGRINATMTTEQQRLGYDASNYFKTTVGSTGNAVFDLAGTSPNFMFIQPVQFLTGSFGSTWIPYTDGNVYLSSANVIVRDASDVEKFRFNNASTRMEFTDGFNVQFGSTTGTKIGTSGSQKLGFFGATPVIQPSVPAFVADPAPSLAGSDTLDITRVESELSAHAASINTIIDILSDLGLAV